MQARDQNEICVPVGTLEARHLEANVVLLQCRVLRNGSGQQTPAERAVGDKTDAELVTDVEDLGLDLARR